MNTAWHIFHFDFTNLHKNIGLLEFLWSTNVGNLLEMTVIYKQVLAMQF